MAVLENPYFVQTIRLLITLILHLFLLLFALLGGLLNRCRGGYINVEKILLHGNNTDIVQYWLAHCISRVVFALPTAMLVAVVGLHLRGGVSVLVLSLTSLFVCWNSYVNVGFERNNYMGQEGVFDWLLGRQEKNWHLSQRVLREFSGMSLHGLVWTVPQGYVLQQMGFGWQYSLSGSLMGAVYALGAGISHLNLTKNDFFAGTSSIAEFCWGTFLWYVLLLTSIPQLVYRVRKWVFVRSTCSIQNPLRTIQVLLYESLNRYFVRLWYEATVVVILLIFASTVMFYSLVIQKDLLNKGETMFGLFATVLALTFCIGWTWSNAWHTTQLKKVKKKAPDKDHSSVRQARAPHIKDIDRLEGGFPNFVHTEKDPLLPWPYSHPDKALASSPRSYNSYSYSDDESRSSTPIIGYGSHLQGRNYYHSPSTQPSPNELTFVVLWPSIEKWIWLDGIAILRHLLGLLIILCFVVVSCTTMVSVAWDMSAPRFDPEYSVLANSSVWKAM